MQTIHYILEHGTGRLTERDIAHLQALYKGEISFTDQQIGRVLDELDQLGLTKNTILVITADHGESLGTLGRWFHGPRLNYTDIHVPLIIRFPGVIPANQSIPATVESIDIMPTILDLLQVPVPPAVQGTSLVPLIRGHAPDADHGAVTMLDSYQQISLVTPQWHLIFNHGLNRSELYAYHTDPLELNDQADLHREVVAQLVQQLNERLDQLGFRAP
jgi:iduronate 2-sulfatase